MTRPAVDTTVSVRLCVAFRSALKESPRVFQGVQQEELHEKLPGAEPGGQAGRPRVFELVFYAVEARQARRQM